MDKHTFFLAVAACYAVMSCIAFIAFARDKQAARKGLERTPESTLHLLELLGGWPGALGSIWLLRHKNRKASFIAVTVCIVLLHGIIWGWVFMHG